VRPTTEPRMFPVLLSFGERRASPDCPRWVPWELLEPHEEWALRNHGRQSLETLASRGGLGPCEMVAVLECRRWHAMPHAEAVARLCEFVAAYEATRSANDTEGRP
jgi:hypothetical protein